MNVEHFALKRPPFRAIASGQEVFLGPQTAKTIKALRKALTTQDAVVTVSGAVGVGKTAIVGRALDALGGAQTRIRIGRMAIAHDEILDFLLDVLGVTNPPASTIRRIATFRAILMQKREQGERVFVIVEDGVRLGEEPLAEIEALTAADGGAGGGAAVIIMGDTTLGKALDQQSLARLNQRIRLRHTLGSLSEGELGGYLKHSFRLCGGDFDQLFQAGATALLYQLSDGIPRVCNNLIESTMAAAAEKGKKALSLDLIRRVAKDEYGLTSKSTSADVSQVAEALVLPEEETAAGQTPDIELSQSMSVPMPDFAAEMNAAAADSAEPEPMPESAAAAPVPEPEPEPEPELSEDDIPELINDTIPELTALTQDIPVKPPADADIPTLEEPEEPVADVPRIEPEPAPAAEAASPQPAAAEAPVPERPLSPEPAPAPEPVSAEPEIPELSLSLEATSDALPAADEVAPAAAAAPSEDDVPDWEKDPTLAELKPDIEALESALAEVSSEAKEEPKPVTPAEPDVEIKLQDPSVPGVPELKLDESIQKSIDEAEAALEKQASTIAEGREADELAAAAPEPAEQAMKADGELEKIARGLARAKTLEDIDDQMAETLFGEEFSMVAAEVAAKVANMNLDEEEAPVEEAPSLELEPAVAVATESEPSKQPATAAQTAAPAQAAAAPAARNRMDTSASARLRTLKALNAGQAPAKAAAPAKPAAKGADGPATIENQFADIAPKAKQPEPAPVVEADVDDDDDDGDEKKGGFFSRFKR
ncbi:MAG: hypothetical protein AAFX10_02270 [Pseudomonadota bacterium]